MPGALGEPVFPVLSLFKAGFSVAGEAGSGGIHAKLVYSFIEVIPRRLF
jgi:hypothetical protein